MAQLFVNFFFNFFLCLLVTVPAEAIPAGLLSRRMGTATRKYEYYDNGALSVVHKIFYPTQPGSYPVVYFLSGLNGVIPVDYYNTTLTQLAEKGLIVVAPYGYFGEGFEFYAKADRQIKYIYWTRYALNQVIKDLSGNPQIHADTQRGIIIASHSSGAQVAHQLYKKVRDQISGMLYLDPVDGSPMADTPRAVFPGEKFLDGKPVLILATDLCRVPGFYLHFWPPCCTPGHSQYNFYNAFGAPRWFVELRGFGHADLLDANWSEFVRSISFCKVTDHPEWRESYRQTLVNLAASFAYGINDGFCKKIDNLEDAWRTPIDKTLWFDRHCN